FGRIRIRSRRSPLYPGANGLARLASAHSGRRKHRRDYDDAADRLAAAPPHRYPIERRDNSVITPGGPTDDGTEPCVTHQSDNLGRGPRPALRGFPAEGPAGIRGQDIA